MMTIELKKKNVLALEIIELIKGYFEKHQQILKLNEKFCLSLLLL